MHYCRDNPDLALSNFGCRWWAPGDSTYNYERPWIANGPLFFTDYRSGGRYSCSATSVTSYRLVNGRPSPGNESLVWTAGHCVAPGGGDQRFFDPVVFIPGYKDERRPHGAGHQGAGVAQVRHPPARLRRGGRHEEDLQRGAENAPRQGRRR